MKLKIPAFVKQYAEYKKNLLSAYSAMNESIKAEKEKAIERAVYLVEYGFITIDESMKLLSEI